MNNTPLFNNNKITTSKVPSGPVISPVESQKGIIAVQRCPVENQIGAIAV